MCCYNVVDLYLCRVSKDDGAVENNDEKQGDEAKQSKNVQAELQPHIRVLDSDHGENSKQATKEM